MVTATEFATIARALQHEARRLGIQPPAFRAPPHVDADRSLRRLEESAVVCVRLGRDLHAVVGDMIDGVIAANRITDRGLVDITRAALWEAAGVAVAA